MNDTDIKVKQEKIDPEVEQKIKDQINFKKEPLDDSNVKVEESSSNSSTDSNAEEEEDEAEDKKNIELAKTSNELLTELFQVFNAAPPEELLDDEHLLKKTQSKSKKHKKEKKKKRKRHKDIGDSEDAGNKSDSNELEIKKEKHKHKKKKKHKHKDDEKSKEKTKERTRSRSTEKEKEKEKTTVRQTSNEREKEKNSDNKINSRTLESTLAVRIKKEKEDNVHRHEENSRKRKAITDATGAVEPPAKVHNNDRHAGNSFYNGYSEYNKKHDIKIETERSRRTSEISRRHHYSSKDHPDRNNMSDISLSDEETYLREREQSGGNTTVVERRRDRRYIPDQRSRNRRSAERYHRDTRSRSKKRSRSRDLGIDKKRLLEIARKNAISMFKRGNLPGCANMSEDVKDKVLLQMRYGGRTVQDLTDFCRKISNGEPLSSMSSDNDSDVDKDGNTKAFHHPFQLKERDPIVLQLRNTHSAVPAKREDLTKAITMQFPVSSGQQHRISEHWMPIETKSVSLAPLPPLPAAIQSTSIFKPNVQKNVFEKTLPIAEQQMPAFRPVGADETNSQPEAVMAHTTTNNFEPVPEKSTVQPSPATTTDFVPDVPIPSSNVSDSVFPESNSIASFDVSSIISKRLSALRRLQENPMDSEAIKMMYNSQKEMSSWASSKHLPGQFTGSTGANVLKAHELNSGPQVWARRDQLTSSKPVTGGMGMHLLQKMGWKPGEGLGREKTGTLQPLLLDVKLDKRGLVARDDHSVANGVRISAPNKKRPNNINDAMQNFQNKHPVCILNELTSKRKWTPPLYELVSEGGPSHSKKFLFSVSMNGQTYTPVEGSNTKKEAKMLAAKFCLEQIGVLPQ